MSTADRQEVALRYAKAFYAIAKEKQVVEKVEEDVALIAEVLNHLDNLLFSPILKEASKRDALTLLCKEAQADEVVLHFLLVVFQKNRLAYLPNIFDAFKRLASEGRGELHVTITSAQTLGQAQLDLLQEGLQKTLNKKIKMHVVEDATLLGGLKVRVGDIVYDDSLARRLELLTEHCKQGPALFQFESEKGEIG
jgi:F-type H+-transporting ATPase subunit delta